MPTPRCTRQKRSAHVTHAPSFLRVRLSNKQRETRENLILTEHDADRMAVLPVSPAIACVRCACRIERVSVMRGHMCLQAEGDAFALHTGCQQRLRGHE